MPPHNKRSVESRKRGPDLLNPLNNKTKSKAARTYRDLLGEHRLEMLHEAKELGRMAATEFEICEFWNINPVTLYSWRARDAAFDSALQHGKDVADKRVERALYARAMGYSYRSEEIKVVEGTVVRVPVIKHEPPNMTALVFWLKNRQRETWRDVHRIEGEVDVKTIERDDPRSIAMAIIATLREAAEASITEAEQNMIEHDSSEAAE